jgi:hypothetical protein
LLGHKDVKTTMIYTHVVNRVPKAVSSSLDQWSTPDENVRCVGGVWGYNPNGTTYGWTQSLAMQRPQAGAFDRKSGRFRLFCFDPAECRRCGASPHGSFFHGGHKPCGNVEP